jgi:hypothetical protein
LAALDTASADILKVGEPDRPAQWLDRDFATDLDDLIVRQFEPVTEALRVAA